MSFFCRKKTFMENRRTWAVIVEKENSTKIIKDETFLGAKKIYSSILDLGEKYLRGKGVNNAYLVAIYSSMERCES